MNKIKIDRNELSNVKFFLIIILLTLSLIIFLFYSNNKQILNIQESNKNIPTMNYSCLYNTEQVTDLIQRNSNLKVSVLEIPSSNYFFSTIENNYQNLKQLKINEFIIEIIEISKNHLLCIGKVSGSNLPQGESYQSLEDKGINEIEIVSIDLREDRAIFIILFFSLCNFKKNNLCRIC